MSVDNYQAAIALTEKIKAQLPIMAEPTKNYLQQMKKQGTRIAQGQKFAIDSVLYMGDDGGICCALRNEETDEQAYIVSITHLVVDPDHSLAPEIQDYQRQRIQAIKLQNSRGFLAEMQRLSPPAASPRKKGKEGFGK
jgi:metal-responsive CopG/Arc/MetJ family transcriptional regulator